MSSWRGWLSRASNPVLRTSLAGNAYYRLGAAEPGTWKHRNAIGPTWLAYWLRYQPDSI
jgi:hypothetical protein